MRFNELNEGPLGGLAGAMRARSKDPKVAAKGKAQLAKAGARKAGSAKGQAAKKKKMARAMLAKWQEQANIVRSQESREPETADLTKWLEKFMGDKAADLGPAYAGKMSDRHVQQYFSKIVDTFYQQSAKAPAAPAAATAAPAAPAAEPAATQSTTDAMAVLKKYGHNDAEAASMIKQALANGANADDAADIVKKAYKKNESTLQRALMSQYLLEAANGKNTHLEHIEDMVFNDGFEGAKGALTYFEQLVSMLATGSGNTAKITTKWDGAPAIVCGIDPADGKFFVGTKSVFAKTLPKLVKSKKNLDEWYTEQPGLYDKLAMALEHLPKLGIGNILQGDFMFDSTSLETATIDGDDVLTFTPNTITYATPIDSDLAKVMKTAKMGIVFHTAYEGDDIESMQASFGVDVSGLNRTKDVWFDDATYKDLTGSASLTPGELKKIQMTMSAIENTMTKIRPEKFDIVIQNKEFTKFVKPFINKLVRDGKLVGDPIAFLKDFLEFYKGKMTAEIDKLKLGKEEEPDSKAVLNRVAKIKSKEDFLEDNAMALLGVLAVYKRLVEIKLLIIDKLHEVEGLGTFIKDGEGYKVTNPEGFVAVGHHGGAIKLVDRLEFSKQNFNAVNAWKAD